MERRRAENGLGMPAVLVRADKPKEGDPVLETEGVGDTAPPTANGGLGVVGVKRGSIAEVKVGSAY